MGHSAGSESSVRTRHPTVEELDGFLDGLAEGEGAHETARICGVGCTDIRLEARGRHLAVLAFESGKRKAAEYAVGLLEHLSKRGLPCPRVLRTGAGELGSSLGGCAGVVLELPSGTPTRSASVSGCRAVGALLGHFHASAADYSGRREPLRGPRWWREAVQLMPANLPAEDQDLLREELRFQGLYRFADLPRGTVHGHLDRNSVLFNGGEPVALVGFGEASTDVLLLDVAAAANTWCSIDGIVLDTDRLRALLAGYHAERPLRAIERGAWPVVMRAAALDSWLGALDPRIGAETADDSAQSRAVLQNRIDSELMLQLHWVY